MTAEAIKVEVHPFTVRYLYCAIVSSLTSSFDSDDLGTAQFILEGMTSDWKPEK